MSMGNGIHISISISFSGHLTPNGPWACWPILLTMKSILELKFFTAKELRQVKY